MRLVFAALCVAAVAFPGLAQARLVGHEEAGFAECDGFFYGGAAPDGLLREAAPGKKLCQKYNGEPRFATLYSTHDKIPVYSAFKYAAAAAAPGEEEQVGVQERWQVEPQIDDPENGLEGMLVEAEITGSLSNLGTNQALTGDYEDSGYERGQLNPGSLHKGDHQKATYTLTNVVPMIQSLQEIWHWEVENLVGRGLAPHCKNGEHLYLVSGAVPSAVKVKDKVSVPESLWLAACCDDGSEAWSVGFVKDIASGNRLEDLSVEALEKKLPEGTRLFKNNCGQDRHDPKKLEVVLHSVKKIQAEEPVLKGKKHKQASQTGAVKQKDGFLKKLYYFIVAPIFRLVSLLFDLTWRTVKWIVSSFFFLAKKLVKGIWTYIKGIFKALIGVVIDVARVGVNILNGIAENIYNVLMVTYKILSIPVNLILDIASFPFYTLGAVPTVLRDIVSGFGGACLLLIDAATNIVMGLNHVVSYLAQRILPNLSSSA